MYKISYKLSLILVFMLYGCSSSPRYAIGSSQTSTKFKRPSKTAISAKSDKKRPKHRRVMNGVSSFYAEDFHGKLTANGEVYDMYGVTAAHKTLPLNTVCRVTNVENNKSLILDCSYGAAKKLDFINQGTTKVKIEVIEWGDGKYMQHREGHK